MESKGRKQLANVKPIANLGPAPVRFCLKAMVDGFTAIRNRTRHVRMSEWPAISTEEVSVLTRSGTRESKCDKSVSDLPKTSQFFEPTDGPSAATVGTPADDIIEALESRAPLGQLPTRDVDAELATSQEN